MAIEANYAVHPGVFLKDFLDDSSSTPKKLSDKIGVSQTVIDNLILGRIDIDQTLAKQLEDAMYFSAKFWLKMQSDFDRLKSQDSKKYLITGESLFPPVFGANQIADRFLEIEAQTIATGKVVKNRMTALRLQKLLYFAQKESVSRKFVLFSDPIEHWTYGPVVPTVYRRFNGDTEISLPELKNEALFVREAEEVVQTIYKKYFSMSLHDLVELSHEEKPYIETKKDELITPERIRDSLHVSSD